jgi:hypothetical protein
MKRERNRFFLHTIAMVFWVPELSDTMAPPYQSQRPVFTCKCPTSRIQRKHRIENAGKEVN